MVIRMSNIVSHILLRANLRNGFKALYSSKTTPAVPKNMLENVISANKQKENGIVYDKKPFKLPLEAGKKYKYLYKQSAPHNLLRLQPIKFQVEETKEYWLCNCKQTANRPFCDGTHKTQAVLEATSVVRQ
ncbi:hypothetical protein NQ314_004123 [Rhamnusium bicolor]|uniref:Iron-binding zinc finger CDGSH type domain-containing protein n=1 Tax=Rhamnusium bicolor TaxID=1586634 RepID=A0AAV8ZLZ1_9CUCU|nr:hypothetical protein NQ314_004123 [Rhamnusium bicolor]